jgi:hypothetical protein
MNFIEYSPLALRTAKPLPPEQQLKHALLGMITELGELADCIKKHVIYGKELDKVNLMEECSDLFWYLNLYMVEKSIGGRSVDTSSEKMIGKAPQGWELVEAVIVCADMTTLLLSKGDDKAPAPAGEAVAIIAGLLCALLLSSGFTLSDCLERNIAKLASRYGEKYSDYLALHRDTAAERTILESHALPSP